MHAQQPTPDEDVVGGHSGDPRQGRYAAMPSEGTETASVRSCGKVHRGEQLCCKEGWRRAEEKVPSRGQCGSWEGGDRARAGDEEGSEGDQGENI